jgi:hypothetical protein
MTEGRAITVDSEFDFRDIVQKTMVAAKSLQAHSKGLTRAQGIAQRSIGSWSNSFRHMKTKIEIIRQMSRCWP